MMTPLYCSPPPLKSKYSGHDGATVMPSTTLLVQHSRGARATRQFDDPQHTHMMPVTLECHEVCTAFPQKSRSLSGGSSYCEAGERPRQKVTASAINTMASTNSNPRSPFRSTIRNLAHDSWPPLAARSGTLCRCTSYFRVITRTRCDTPAIQRYIRP